MSEVNKAGSSDTLREVTGTGGGVAEVAPKDATSTPTATPAASQSSAKTDAQKWRDYQERQKKYSKRYHERKRLELQQKGLHRYAVMFPARAFRDVEDKKTKAVALGVHIGGWVWAMGKDDKGNPSPVLSLYAADGTRLTTITLAESEKQKMPRIG